MRFFSKSKIRFKLNREPPSLTLFNMVTVALLSLSVFLVKSTSLTVLPVEAFGAFSLLLSAVMISSGLHTTAFGDVGIMKVRNSSLPEKFNYTLISVIVAFIISLLCSTALIIFYLPRLEVHISFVSGALFSLLFSIMFFWKNLFYMFGSYRAPAMFTVLFFVLILIQSIILRMLEGPIALDRVILELLAISLAVVSTMMFFIIVKFKFTWFHWPLKLNVGFGSDNIKSAGMYILVWISSQSQWFVIGWFSSLSLVGSAMGFLIMAAPLQILERIFQPKYLMSLRESESRKKNLSVLFGFILKNFIALLLVFFTIFYYSDFLFEYALGGRYLDQTNLLLYLLVMAFLQMLTAGLSGLNRIYSTYKAIYWAFGISPIVSLAFFISVGFKNLTVELIYLSIILSLCSQVLVLGTSVAGYAKR